MTTVTLCGSARFETSYKQVMKELTRAGYVVIGLGSYPSDNASDEGVPTKDWYTPVEKEVFDLVHLEKIKLADIVVVIDRTLEPSTAAPYVGFSTAREILWAKMHNIPIMLLSKGTIPDLPEGIEGLTTYEDRDPDTDEAVALAQHALVEHFAQQIVNQQLDKTAEQILVAALTLLGRQTGTMATFAEVVVNQLGASVPADPLQFLQGVPIPDGWTGPAPTYRTVDGKEGRADEPSDSMTSLPTRALEGTIQMAQAIKGMLEQKRPTKLSRGEVLYKLEMMITSMKDSFDLHD